MRSFLDKFSTVIRGVLSGLDRVLFRGTLRGLAYTRGSKATSGSITSSSRILPTTPCR